MRCATNEFLRSSRHFLSPKVGLSGTSIGSKAWCYWGRLTKRSCIYASAVRSIGIRGKLAILSHVGPVASPRRGCSSPETPSTPRRYLLFASMDRSWPVATWCAVNSAYSAPVLHKIDNLEHFISFGEPRITHVCLLRRPLELGYEGASGQVSAWFCPAGETGKMASRGSSGITWDRTGSEFSEVSISKGRSIRPKRLSGKRWEAQLLKLDEHTEYARANDVTFNALLGPVASVFSAVEQFCEGASLLDDQTMLVIQQVLEATTAVWYESMPSTRPLSIR